jgi:DNA primase large subunit
MTSLDFLAKYPFSEEAKKLVERENLSIEELAYDPLLSKARKMAKERLERAVLRSAFSQPDLLDPASEIYSLIIARIIVEGSKDEILRNLLAEHESKRFMQVSRDESDENLLKIASDLGVRMELKGEFHVNIIDYMRLSKRLRDPRWRAVNRKIEGGNVLLSRDEARRLLAEAVRERILSKIEVPELPPPFMDILKSLNMPKKAVKKSKKGLLPCVESLLDSIMRGENLPHVARFALASHLLAAGWSKDEVLDVFRHSPDFKEKIARYQIEQIAKKGYRPPSCRKMMSWGLCPGECRVRKVAKAD